jgi:hypothetical protein
MCFDVNDYASRKEAHFGSPCSRGAICRAGTVATLRALLQPVCFPPFGGIKKEPLSRLFPHAAKKNHSNFILIVV